MIRYGIYPLFSFPKIPSKKSSAQPIPASRASCTFPGFSTFRFQNKMIDARTSTAIIIQVTTTDSEIPPTIGRVNTVSQFSSSINVSARFPVLLPPFLLIYWKSTPEKFFCQHFTNLAEKYRDHSIFTSICSFFILRTVHIISLFQVVFVK